MSSLNIVADLQSVIKLPANPEESAKAYAERLALKANGIKDDQWQALKEETQLWVNSALEAIEKKKEIPLPAGIEAALAPAASSEESGEEAEGEAEAPSKAKAAKPNKAIGGATRGPKGGFALTDKITLVKKENPFREGTKCFNWYALYKPKMTVEAAIEAGVPRHHIRWDKKLGYIKIG